MNGRFQLLYSQFDLPLPTQSIASALFFAILVVGILGMGVWRAAFARSILGNVSIGKGRLALGVTLGILFHDFLGKIGSTVSFYWFFIELFWGGILFILLYALFHWIASAAEVWLEVAAALRSPRWVYILNLILAIAISSVAFTWLLTSRWVIERTAPTDLLHTVLPFFVIFGNLYIGVFNPFVLVALASLWAVPMAAWFWRKQAAPLKTASWAFLEPITMEIPSQLSESKWQPGLAAQTGIKLGILYCSIHLIIRILVRVSVLDEVIFSNNTYKLIFFYAWIVLAVLMQIRAAVIVSGKVKIIGWAHGLFAAFSAGCVMTVGILAINMLFILTSTDQAGPPVGGGLELIFVWHVFSQVINFGTFLALIPAIAVSTWAGRKSQNHI